MSNSANNYKDDTDVIRILVVLEVRRFDLSSAFRCAYSSISSFALHSVFKLSTISVRVFVRRASTTV